MSYTLHRTGQQLDAELDSTATRLTAVEGEATSLDGRLDTAEASLGAIGTYQYVDTTQTSVAANTEKNLCSLSLQPGVWTLCGFWKFARGNENFQASLGISSVSGSSQSSSVGYTQFPVTSECNVPAVTVSRVINLNAATTIYLVAWHNGTAAKTISAANLQAVRVK